MEIIYQGTYYSVPISSPIVLVGARLYNKANDTCVEMLMRASGEKDENGYDLYEAALTAAQTKDMPLGVYALELYSGSVDSPVIEATKLRYAQVCKSSFGIGE